MVSSGMGSFGVTTDPDRFESTLHALIYPSSKAALNMITTQYAKALTGYQVSAVDPGYTGDRRSTGSAARRPSSRAPSRPSRPPPLSPVRRPGTFTDAAGAVPW